MSLAFTLPIDASRAATRFQRTAVAIGLLGAVAMAAAFEQGGMRGWAIASLVGGLALTAWFGLRRGHPGPVGQLSVDAEGTAQWLASEGDPVAAGVRAWRRGRSLVWIQLRDSSDRPLDLLIGRHQCAESQWSALNRWLLWLERGSSD